VVVSGDSIGEQKHATRRWSRSDAGANVALAETANLRCLILGRTAPVTQAFKA
jgi:hypothetical protein